MPTVGGLPLAAITFFVLTGSQSAMNGPGAFFLSLIGVDVSRVLIACEHILERNKHVIDNNRSALSHGLAPPRHLRQNPPHSHPVLRRRDGAAISVTIFVVTAMSVHAPLGFTPLAVMVTLTVFLTTKTTRHLNSDRPPHFPYSSRRGTT